MASLADIAPLAESVTIRGKEISVYGVSAKGIAALMQRFPEIKKALAGKTLGDITPERVMELIPDAIAAVIAAGTGHPGDSAVEKTAETLPVGDQVSLLEKIIKLTMPEGVGPFVAKLRVLQGAALVSPAATGPGMGSPEQSKA